MINDVFRIISESTITFLIMMFVLTVDAATTAATFCDKDEET